MNGYYREQQSSLQEHCRGNAYKDHIIIVRDGGTCAAEGGGISPLPGGLEKRVQFLIQDAGFSGTGSRVTGRGWEGLGG